MFIVDAVWLHRVIEYCNAQTSKSITREGGEQGTGAGCQPDANEVVQIEVQTSVYGVETWVDGDGGKHKKRVVEGVTYTGNGTSESSNDEFNDNIYNVTDENEVPIDEDDLEDFNRPTFLLGMTYL